MNNRLFRVRATLILVAAYAITGLFGCKGKDSAVVGKWVDEHGATLMFKADHSFAEGDPEKGAIGTWTAEDKKVTVMIKTMGGKSTDQFVDEQVKSHPGILTPAQIESTKKQIRQPAEFTLSDDGKSITLSDASLGTTVKFSRSDR